MESLFGGLKKLVEQAGSSGLAGVEQMGRVLSDERTKLVGVGTLGIVAASPMTLIWKFMTLLALAMWLMYKAGDSGDESNEKEGEKGKHQQNAHRRRLRNSKRK